MRSRSFRQKHSRKQRRNVHTGGASEDRRADGELLQGHRNATIQEDTDEDKEEEDKELWFYNFYSVFCFKTPFSSPKICHGSQKDKQQQQQQEEEEEEEGKINSSEDKKERIKSEQMSFLFPKERRRERQLRDGGMRSRGGTLSPKPHGSSSRHHTRGRGLSK